MISRLSVVGLLALGACSSPDAPGEVVVDPESGLVKALEGGFDVAATVSLEGAEAKAGTARPECLSFDLTSQLRKSYGDWALEAGISGKLATAPLTRGASSYDAFDETWRDTLEHGGGSEDVWLGDETDDVLVIPAGACCERLHLSELQLTPEGDGFRAAAKGLLSNEACPGDVLYETPVGVELVGVPDVTAPTIALPTEPIHPLDWVELRASEALAKSTLLKVSLPDGLTLVGAEALNKGSFAFWSLKVPSLGAFGVDVTVDAEVEDWAGNAASVAGTLRTIPDPGLFAQDGFEGEVLAAGTKPRFGAEAIAGSRSLLIGQDDAVTFHLERQRGDSVRFEARVLATRADALASDALTRTVRYRVATERGIVNRGELELAFASEEEGAQASAQTVTVPLHESGDSVIVAFDIESFDDDHDCSVIDCVGLPALIDDLRVE